MRGDGDGSKRVVARAGLAAACAASVTAAGATAGPTILASDDQRSPIEVRIAVPTTDVLLWDVPIGSGARGGERGYVASVTLDAVGPRRQVRDGGEPVGGVESTTRTGVGGEARRTASSGWAWMVLEGESIRLSPAGARVAVPSAGLDAWLTGMEATSPGLESWASSASGPARVSAGGVLGPVAGGEGDAGLTPGRTLIDTTGAEDGATRPGAVVWPNLWDSLGMWGRGAGTDGP